MPCQGLSAADCKLLLAHSGQLADCQSPVQYGTCKGNIALLFAVDAVA